MIIELHTAPGEELTYEQRREIIDAIKALGHTVDFQTHWGYLGGEAQYTDLLRRFAGPQAVEQFQRRQQAIQADGRDPGLYINGKRVEATEFAYDGCHKVYLIDTPAVRETLVGYGYEEGDFHPVSALPELWETTCPLRFISWGDLRDDDLVPQCEDGTVEYVAGGEG